MACDKVKRGEQLHQTSFQTDYFVMLMIKYEEIKDPDTKYKENL